MALRTPEFTVPQPVPSPIYQAFNLGLQHLVELPFEIGAEKRAEKRAKSLADYQQQLGIGAAETEATYLENMRTRSDIEDNYVATTPEAEGQLRTAGMDPANLFRGFEGKQYLPKTALAEASRLNSPVDAGTQNLLTGIMGHLVERKIIPAAILGNGPDNAFTHKQLEETLPVVQESLSLASLDQQDALRRAEMDIAALNRREMDETRIFSLLRDYDPAKTLGLGVRELDANGQPTGHVRPMNLTEQIGFQNPFLDVIADFEKQHGGVSPSIQHYIDARSSVDHAGVAALPFATQRELDTEVSRISSDPNSADMQIYSQMMMNLGLVRGTDGKIPTDWSSAAAILKANPKLLRAFIATQYFPNGYSDVVNSQSIPGAATFDPVELEFMNNVFKVTRRGTAGGGTPEAPPAGGGQGLNPPKAQGHGLFQLPQPPEQGGPTQFFSPFSSAPPTRSFTSPSDYNDYNSVVAVLGTRLKQNPELYPQMRAWVDSSLSSPDAALQFFRTHGFDQSFYTDMTTGTTAQKESAWRRHRNDLLWALEDSYHSATESPNNTVTK